APAMKRGCRRWRRHRSGTSRMAELRTTRAASSKSAARRPSKSRTKPAKVRPRSARRHGKFASASSCDPSENRTGHQAGAARIIEIEQSADQFAGGEQARDRHIFNVEYMPRWINLQTTKGESNAAADRVAFKRRLLHRVRPVRLVDREPHGALAVLDVRIEFDVTLHRGVVFLDGLHEPRGIDVLHALHQFFEAVGANLGGAAQLVFIAQERKRLRVEDLPGVAAGLREYRASVL